MKTMKKSKLQEKGNEILKDRMTRGARRTGCIFFAYEPTNPAKQRMMKKWS